MKHKITIVLSGPQPSIEIDLAEYSRIKEAKRNLVIFNGIEEKFDLLLENYADYEQALLDLALKRMLREETEWASFRRNFNIVNRRIINLLSAARLYVDQVKHDLSIIYGSDSQVMKALQIRLSQEYDGNFGYRAMEAIRNYMQHCSLPIHRVSYRGKSEQPGKPSSKIFYTVVPSLDFEQLEEDKKFKRAIALELKAKGRYIPLTPLVREYVEALGRVHESLRGDTSKDVAMWEATLAEVETKALNTFRDLFDSLAVVAEDEDGTYPEIEHIFSDLWKYRQSLVEKNRFLNGLAKRYVSGDVESRDA